MKKYIIVILLTTLCVFLILLQIKCNRLSNEVIELKFTNSVVSDSLKKENILLSEKVILLEDSINVYSKRIDSLKRIKKTIIIKQIIEESKNISEGVEKLKYNLQCEKR